MKYIRLFNESVNEDILQEVKSLFYIIEDHGIIVDSILYPTKDSRPVGRFLKSGEGPYIMISFRKNINDNVEWITFENKNQILTSNEFFEFFDRIEEIAQKNNLDIKVGTRGAERFSTRHLHILIGENLPPVDEINISSLTQTRTEN